MHATNPPPPAQTTGTPFDLLEPKTVDFYLRAIDILETTGVRFAIGGAYALAYYAGIVRHTKDLDIFVKRADAAAVIDQFDRSGHVTQWTHPHWIAKVFSPDGEDFVDIIYGSGNGMTAVDDEWLANAEDGQVLGRGVKICPAEEIIWSKSFIQERDRFDGADVAHLLLARGRRLNWDRLLRRVRGHEAVLLAHLILFRYIYPCQRDCIPDEVIQTLTTRANEDTAGGEKLCRGTFLSYQQYHIDIHDRGHIDPRIVPRGMMTFDEVKRWTDAPK